MPVAPQVPPVPGNAEDNRLPLPARAIQFSDSGDWKSQQRMPSRPPPTANPADAGRLCIGCRDLESPCARTEWPWLPAESFDVWPRVSYNGLSLSVHVCSRVTWLDARRRMAAGDCTREDQRRMKTIDAITTATVPVVTDDDGVMRVGETRVTLDTVIGAFLDGAAAEEIVFQYRPDQHCHPSGSSRPSR